MRSGKIVKRLVSALAAASLMISLLPVSFAAGGTTYYVSGTAGAAGNPGTSASPFRTIAQAIGAMSDGDICIIRDGVYYETLTVDGKNNLTFRAATNGNVTISGGTVISSWERDTTMDHVWKTSTASFVDASGNDRSLLFQNGELCYEARWPNLTTSGTRHPLLLRENYARVDSGSTERTIIVDDALTTDSSIAGKNLAGASVWCASGVAYWSYVYPIESVSGNTIELAETYTYTDSSGVQQTASVTEGSSFWPGTNRAQDGKNIYYIFDSKDLLDTNGEWYRDRSTGTLYFYDDSGSAPKGVELRAREYAIDIDHASGISIEGINVRGAIVNLDDNARDCVIKNATIETVDYLMPREGERSVKGKQPGALGVTVSGTNNLITGCEIMNMYGEGILLEGTGNRIINNYIHDINFEHTYSDGVYITGSNHLVSHNTIEGLGRGAIGGLFTSCELAYNDMSDGCRLSRDGGIIYLTNNDFKNSEFHHNILHDSVDNEGMQYGLYLDSMTTGVIVYRNLLYNLEANDGHSRRSIDINPNSLGNIFFNNTVANTNPIGGLTGDRSQTVIVNNLFQSDYLQSAWMDVNADHNVVATNVWTNPSAGDYTLSSAATSVIDVGVPVPGVAEDYLGEAPDCGAFENGETAWTAGHDVSNKEFSKETFRLNEKIPYRNYVVNGGFETFKQVTSNGVTSICADGGWTDSDGGEIPLLTERAWTTYGSYAMSGNYSAKLAEGQTITQTITGLKPYTTYLAGGYAQLSGEYTPSGNGSIPENYSKLTRGNTITGFTTDTEHCIRYPAMNFGTTGYDALQFRLQFTSSSTRTGSPSRSIEVWLGNPKAGGERLSSVSVLPTEVPSYTHAWLFKTAKFGRSLTGSQEIYVVFKGDFYGVAVAGKVFFDDTDGEDQVTLTAKSDSGEQDSISFSGRGFSSSLRGVEVTTGSEGSIVLSLTKSGGTLNGYVDEIRVSETYNPMDIYMGTTEVKDENGTLVYAIHKGDMHIINGELVSSGEAGTVTATLRGIDGTGLVCEGTGGVYAVTAGGVQSFSLNTRAPLSDHAMFLLSLKDETGRTFSHTITNGDVLKQAEGETTLLLKDFAIRNMDGTLLMEPTCGEFNLFETALENKSDESIPMLGFMAIYKDGALFDLMYLNRNIDPNESDRFWLGTFMPEQGNITVKLFAWKSFADMNPLFEHALFETTN